MSEAAYLERIRSARARWQRAEAGLNDRFAYESERRAVAELLRVTDALLEEAEHLHDRLNALERRGGS